MHRSLVVWKRISEFYRIKFPTPKSHNHVTVNTLMYPLLPYFRQMRFPRRTQLQNDSFFRLRQDTAIAVCDTRTRESGLCVPPVVKPRSIVSHTNSPLISFWLQVKTFSGTCKGKFFHQWLTTGATSVTLANR